ncbi:MAG: DUF2147 domain-containing protein [Proteobacteria bacterium]|nr:DUF2147 domain-containing protein [Pseudomonadota bacterium]
MRIMKLIAPVAIAISLAPATFASAFAASNPVGVWLDDTGRGAVEIKPCGNALCGNVVWVKSSSDNEGCGKQIIGNVTPAGSGHWDNGWIYSPEKGRKYDVELTPLSNGNLKVVGYAGIKFLSRTMIWKPAPADLQLCAGTTNGSTTSASAPAAITPNADTSAKSVASPPSTKVDANAAAPAAPAANTTADAQKPFATPDQGKTPPQETAKADSNAANDSGSDSSGSDLGKMQIGGMELDKFFKKTKDGKCKLDLPWVKVTLDCDR